MQKNKTKKPKKKPKPHNLGENILIQGLESNVQLLNPFWSSKSRNCPSDEDFMRWYQMETGKSLYTGTYRKRWPVQVCVWVFVCSLWRRLFPVHRIWPTQVWHDIFPRTSSCRKWGSQLGDYKSKTHFILLSFPSSSYFPVILAAPGQIHRSKSNNIE